jgi:hypothetical protein
MLPENDHLVITEPDRYYNDALKLLLIDWSPFLLDQALQAIKSSKQQLVIHIFNSNDNNYKWLLDVADQADIVGINFDTTHNNDVFKGMLLLRNKSFYFGRLDLKNLFPNHTEDPIGKLLVLIGDKLSQMEEK